MPPIFDLHCDTLYECHTDPAITLAHNPKGHRELGKLSAGGSLAQCFAIFIHAEKIAAELGGEEPCWEFYQMQSARFAQELRENSSRLALARTVAEIEKNRADKKISALLTIEESGLLYGKLERLAELRRDGVSMMTLTWNFENCIGFPNSPDPALHARGLKEFGHDAVEEMARLGILVDVSHLSEGGFYDVAAKKRPFVASHSCARGLCDHPRNLTDHQLRTLGDCGGLVGVNFYSRFLTGGTHTAIEDILRHARYLVNTAGEDAVALGSDFDGIGCTLEFEDFAGMPRLVDALAREFSPAQVDKICFGNALRVWQTVGTDYR